MARVRVAKASKKELRAVAEDALDVLRADPRRLRALLRSLALQGDDLAELLDDAGHAPWADKARSVATSLRGAAILPAVASVALARHLLKKALG
jgi:hypothetical protein